MKMKFLLSLVSFTLCNVLSGQIKIGDNPQNIDASSVLELESSSRVLVITRISTSQMNSIVPSQGAIVYNTDEQCLYFYDGASWLNMCETFGLTFTADPIVNPTSTIVITENGDNRNFEVGEITGANIVDFSISGVDIQNNSITADKLAPDSVGSEELQDNTVADDEIDYNQVTLNDFNNDAGFITGAQIVSPDPNNSITDNGGAFYDNTPVLNDIAANAAAIAADGDTDAVNEIQSLSLTDNDLTISGANTVDLSVFNNTGTDNQNISTNGTPGNIAIENGNTIVINVADADADATNEIQTITSADGSVGINPVGVNDFDLSVPLGSDNQDISTNGSPGDISIDNGSTIALNVDDADADPLNEIQTITSVDGSVVINPVGVNDIDLSVPIGSDNQDITTDGTPGDITIDNGSTIVLNVNDADADPANEFQNIGEVLAVGNDGGGALIKNISDPVDPQDAATRAFVLANAGTGTTELADQATIVGTGVLGDEFEVNDGSINSNKITDGTIMAIDLGNNAIETAKILDANVTPIKIAPSPTPNQFLNTDAGGNVVWADLPAGGNPAAADVSFVPTGNTTSADVQAAIEEIQSEIDGISGGGAANPNDELITSFALVGTDLNIAEGTNIVPSVDLSSLVNDADADPANEIQNITSADLSVTVNPVGTGFDLSVPAGSDNQNILGSGLAVETLTIGIENGTSQDVSLAPFALETELAAAIAVSEAGDGDTDDTNEIQNIVSGDLSVTVTPVGTGFDLSVPAGSDNQNIQGSALTVETLTIGIENGTSQDVNLAAFTLETELAAAIAASEAADGDTDDTNEIQNITSADLSISINPVGTGFDLSVPAGSDNQNIQGSGLAVETLTIGIENGTSQDVSLAPFALETELAAAIAASDAADGDTDDTNEIQTITSTDGSVTLVQTGDDYDLSVAAGGNNLANTNLTQLAEDRTYNLVNQDLAFLNGNIGIGTPAPSATLHVAGSLRLNNEFLDTNGQAGTNGQILSSTGTATDWIDPPIGIIVSTDAPNSIAAGTDGGALYDDPDNDPNNEIQTLTQVLAQGADANNIVINNLADPVIAQDAATKAYVDAQVVAAGTIVSTDVPNSITTGTDGGALYDDPDNDPNNEIQTLTQVLAQGTDANNNVINNLADPVIAQDAATKAYVDAQVVAAGTIVSTDAPNSITAGTDGGALYDDPDNDPNNEIQTLTQVLAQGADANNNVINNLADPVIAQDAATKAYVDANSGGHTGTSGSIFFADNATGAPTQNNTELFWDASNNRLGVGTNNPARALEVVGETRSTSFATPGGSAALPGYGFSTNNDFDTGMFRAANNELGLSTGGNEALRIDNGQNVGIGITAPTERLHVGGNILATGTITPDFVFETYFDGKSISKPDYKIMSLSEIENFARVNKHLPGVPSAKEVETKGGIVVNRATEINLEKIEELFLHTINQEKKINQLETKNQAILEELNMLKKELEAIKHAIKEK